MGAVQVAANDMSVMLLIVDAPHAKSTRRSFERTREGERPESELTVLRAAEIIRVTLIAAPSVGRSEVTAAAPRVPSAEPTASPAAPEPRSSRKSRLSATVRPAALLTRGLRPGLDLVVGGDWQPSGARGYPALQLGGLETTLR